jgi:hypothetical protein
MLISKSELIGKLQHEIHILVHLCSKIEPAMLDYRPTPKQRSTIELLRYLNIMGPVLLPSVLQGTFLIDDWNAAEARSAGLDFSSLVTEITAQAAFYASTLEATPEEVLQGEITMFGSTASRAMHIINFVVCGHAAYRTQLFCYLKACGREELSTMNLWAGADA